MRNPFFLKIALLAQLTAFSALRVFGDQSSTSDQIRYSKTFPQELVWVGDVAPAEADSRSLLVARRGACVDLTGS